MVSRPCPKRIDDRLLLRDILKGVSRSFYLTIRVLPAGMRRPVAVAYLLARAADTIADTRALPPPQRLGAIAGLPRPGAGAGERRRHQRHRIRHSSTRRRIPGGNGPAGQRGPSVRAAGRAALRATGSGCGAWS